MNLITPETADQIVDLVKRAGTLLIEHWPGKLADPKSSQLKVFTKDDGSFVTEADFAANKIIVNGLRFLTPTYAILSEEGPQPEKPSGFKNIWVIDPLDGTKSFINGKDDFSILMALCTELVPTFSIMSFPARDIFAIARKGQGAVSNGQRLSVSASDSPQAGSIYLRNVEQSGEIFLRKDLDSGCAFYGVASGELDGAIVKLSRHKEWDLAAPTLMIKEAGGRVTDEIGNEPPFGGNDIKFKYFIASNGKIHSKLLEIVANIRQ